MRTLAFYFAAETAAQGALAALRASSGLVPGEVEVAPLVVDGREGNVLALSIDGVNHARVVEIASRHGGRLVVDVPREWTTARATGPVNGQS